MAEFHERKETFCEDPGKQHVDSKNFLRYQYSQNIITMSHEKSSVISQKGESKSGCFKTTKYAKFSEKKNIFYPLIRDPDYASEIVTLRFPVL